MSADDRAALAGAFPATHAYYAGLVRDPLTEVERYPTPFFERAAVYRLVHRDPFHPAILYAAVGPDGTAVLLTDDPAAFAALARAARRRHRLPADALAYALDYLELTGPRAELRYVDPGRRRGQVRPPAAPGRAGADRPVPGHLRPARPSPAGQRRRRTASWSPSTPCASETSSATSCTSPRAGRWRTGSASAEHGLPLVAGV